MTQASIPTTSPASLTLGLDLGDDRTHFCLLGSDGGVVERGDVATTRVGLSKLFTRLASCLVAMEVCGQSAWISKLAEDRGHRALVANSRRLAALTKDHRKNDRNDAELIARLARADCELLKPIQHKPEQVHADRELLSARGVLVDSRTRLINHLRQIVKVFGYRIPSCSPESIHKRALEHVPDCLQTTLTPFIGMIKSNTEQIRAYDKEICRLAEVSYPVTSVFEQVGGVGKLIATRFVLTIVDPSRFRRSRQVGAYLGIVPRSRQSGKGDPQLRITKAGDREMRRLLVIAANHILGRGADCDLRRYGVRVAARGGKNARKRAKVAVARKLAVLLHRLWVTGEVYDPFRQAKRNGELLPA
jgi:transposase